MKRNEANQSLNIIITYDDHHQHHASHFETASTVGRLNIEQVQMLQ